MVKAVLGFMFGILLMPVIGAVVAVSGRFPFEATAAPPRWERRLANLALDPAVERKAEGLQSPVPSTDESLAQGMKIYRDHCAGCHGEPGKPSRWGRNNFYPPAPQLADRGDHDPVPEIFVVVKYGIRYTGMAGWQRDLSDDDIWRVATFLGRVKSLPPDLEANWRKAP